MKIDDGIREEAARWFAASKRGPMSLGERQAFDAWRADRVNQTALAHMHETWGELAGLKRSAPAARVGTPQRFRFAVAAVILACFGASYLTYETFWDGSSIRTAIGEQRSATLADGSVINLNVATALSYNLGARDRVVDMSTGEAAFFVHHDTSKPFFVRTGAYEVRAVGTAFNVRNRGGAVDVSVLQGKVSIAAISGVRAGRQLALVSAGKRVALGDPAVLSPEPARIERADPQSMAEWRARTLDYEDAPISRVVEDFNAFFPRPIIVDPALGNQRVTLRLQVDDREHALQTLRGLLDLRLKRGANQDMLVEPGQV